MLYILYNFKLQRIFLPLKKKIRGIEKVDFAAVLTVREEVRVVVAILDTALATFQSRNDNEDLNYSVKVRDINKIKEVHIDIDKPVEKVDVVAVMYKSETPSCEGLGNLCKGNITSQQLKGPLKEKDIH